MKALNAEGAERAELSHAALGRWRVGDVTHHCGAEVVCACVVWHRVAKKLSPVFMGFGARDTRFGLMSTRRYEPLVRSGDYGAVVEAWRREAARMAAYRMRAKGERQRGLWRDLENRAKRRAAFLHRRLVASAPSALHSEAAS